MENPFFCKCKIHVQKRKCVDLIAIEQTVGKKLVDRGYMHEVFSKDEKFVDMSLLLLVRGEK